MVDLLVPAMAIATTTILAWSGLSKLYGFDAFAKTVRAVLPAQAPVGPASAMIVSMELAVPIGVLAGLNLEAGILVVVLGALFAAAGTIAGARRLHVECRCFGISSGHELGWRQATLLPAWILAGYGIAKTPTPPLELRLETAAVVLVGIVGVQAIRCARLYRNARADRRAFAGG